MESRDSFPPQEKSAGKTRTEAAFLKRNRRRLCGRFKNNKHAGATTNTFSDAHCLYLAIRVNENVYGVLGVALAESALEAFENSILLSVLGECALALENEKHIREKEERRCWPRTNSFAPIFSGRFPTI